MSSRKVVRRFVVLISIFFMIGASLFIKQARSEGSPPQDPFVAANEYPWSGVGKLNNSTYGFCSAVLVSPKHALTAAHCLFFRGKFLPAQALHLVFGYDKGLFRDNLHISAFYVPPQYDPLKPYDTLAYDWALLLIDGTPQAHPLDLVQSVKSDAVLNFMTAGYSKLMPYRMTADRQCHLVGRTDDNAILFDSCKAPQGFAGGPVLFKTDDSHSVSVAGIHVGNQVWQGLSLAVAISSEGIWRAIKPCIVYDECHFQYGVTGKEPTAAEVLAGLPNLGLTSTASCAADDQNCPTTFLGRLRNKISKIKARFTRGQHN